MKKQRVSEFTSYIYIKKELENLGWNTKNPERNVEGEVYTQQECLDNEEIAKQLINKKPEYVVKVDEDKLYIVEAKGTIDKIDVAFSEAMEYANLVNQSNVISAPIISGVAGNDEDGYIVKSAYCENGEFKIINYHGKEITSLVSKELALELVETGNATIRELDVNEEQLLKIAEEINEALHLGSINKDERAAVMATLLLSLIDDTKPNYNASPAVFVKDINNRAEEVLIQHNKREFFKHIVIKLPSKLEAQTKYKKALVSTIFKLMKINIRAAMNSGTDILGKFYEVFLKYGNGAKDIGIVLTPRNVTEFACDVINVTNQDLIYDPTCGTGGFLVSAFDFVRKNSTQEQIREFRKHRIFGVEQQPKIAALAIVNMIFRGDGSNNIIDNNCLSINLDTLILNDSKSAEYVGQDAKNIKPPVTKVLMNPPFALKSKDEKEYKFIEHALKQMEDTGILFAIIPVSVMIKSGAYRTWRKEKLLAENTLLSVITLPSNLFNNVGVHTCAIIVKKGIPHDYAKNVLWLRCVNDGYRIKKGKRITDKNVPNDLETCKNLLKLFILSQNQHIPNIPEFQKACPIDKTDKVFELVPEAYLDMKEPNNEEIEDGINLLFRESAAFIIRAEKENEIRGKYNEN